MRPGCTNSESRVASAFQSSRSRHGAYEFLAGRVEKSNLLQHFAPFSHRRGEGDVKLQHVRRQRRQPRRGTDDGRGRRLLRQSAPHTRRSPQRGLADHRRRTTRARIGRTPHQAQTWDETKACRPEFVAAEHRRRPLLVRRRVERKCQPCPPCRFADRPVAAEPCSFVGRKRARNDDARRLTVGRDRRRARHLPRAAAAQCVSRTATPKASSYRPRPLRQRQHGEIQLLSAFCFSTSASVSPSRSICTTPWKPSTITIRGVAG